MNHESDSLPPILEVLKDRPMAFDGAMGSLLYESGYFINHSFDEANLTKRDQVFNCHKHYVDAGADIIETNTFSANRFLLSRYGIADKVIEINREGALLAKEAAGGKAYVAGAIGPTGEGIAKLSKNLEARVRTAFREQMEALSDAKVDLLILETFHHSEEMRIALEIARDIFPGCIIAQMSFFSGVPTSRWNRT